MDIESIVAELKGELTRIGEVIGLLEGNAPTRKRLGRPPGSTGKKTRLSRGRGLTPAGRRKLSEAMRLRWAQRRGTTSASKAGAKVAVATTPKKRGGLTAAGRKKLSDARKKRWAEKKRKAS